MIDFLHDHRGALVIVTILVWMWFLWALKRQASPATAGSGSGIAPRLPGTGRQPIGRGGKDIVPQQRTSTGGLAPSIEAGVAEHHVRGSAATAKLDVPPPKDEKRRPTESLKPIKPAPPLPTPEQLKSADKVLPRPTTAGSGEAKADDDEAMNGLFAGLKDREDTDTITPADMQVGGPGTRAIKKANRLEEIGFHHQIESDKLPAQSPAPPAAGKPAIVERTGTDRQPAAEKPAAPITPVPAPAAPPKPRTQTAELDDILKRIDKVLAENPAPGDKPAAPTPPPAPAAAAPKPPEKLDPSDVLKRIDQALAESQRGNSAEVTMLDPDWEDDAKSHAPAAPPAPPAAPAPAAAPKPPSVRVDKPAVPAPPAKAKTTDGDLPDWAKPDAEDEKDTKSGDSDGKGDQQKLF